jgi:hypothetical protein
MAFIALQAARAELDSDMPSAAVQAPGLATPWPNPKRFPVTRRLLAYWRWEAERGEDSEAARNARTSLVNRTAGIGVEVL